MADKDNPDGYFEGFLGEDRPNYQGYSDQELSDAIARVAISKGHDPSKEGVAVSDDVMREEDSEAHAYQKQLEAKLVRRMAVTLGMTEPESNELLMGLGTLPAPIEPTVGDLLAEQDALELASNDIGAEVATVEDDESSDLQVYADFVRQVRMYDKWLRPLAVFLGALWFASAVGLSAPTAVFFIFLAVGTATYTPASKKPKAIEAESSS